MTVRLLAVVCEPIDLRARVVLLLHTYARAVLSTITLFIVVLAIAYCNCYREDYYALIAIDMIMYADLTVKITKAWRMPAFPGMAARDIQLGGLATFLASNNVNVNNRPPVQEFKVDEYAHVQKHLLRSGRDARSLDSAHSPAAGRSQLRLAPTNSTNTPLGMAPGSLSSDRGVEGEYFSALYIVPPRRAVSLSEYKPSRTLTPHTHNAGYRPQIGS